MAFGIVMGAIGRMMLGAANFRISPYVAIGAGIGGILKGIYMGY